MAHFRVYPYSTPHKTFCEKFIYKWQQADNAGIKSTILNKFNVFNVDMKAANS